MQGIGSSNYNQADNNYYNSLRILLPSRNKPCENFWTAKTFHDNIKEAYKIHCNDEKAVGFFTHKLTKKNYQSVWFKLY